jgi:hypothetical protein
MNQLPIPNIAYVQFSLSMASRSLVEMNFILNPENEDQGKLVKTHTFRYYLVSLQYVFLMEIIKLYEKSSTRYPDNNHASIEKASEALNVLDSGFGKLHLQILNSINTIRQSSLFVYLKDLRDKKFAHTDGQTNLDPLSLPILDPTQAKECMVLLDETNAIWANITQHLGYTFGQNVETRTRNFIRYHSVYKKYFRDNFCDAHNRGYSLR